MLKIVHVVSEEFTQSTAHRDKEIRCRREQLRDLGYRLTGIWELIASNFQIMVNSKNQGIVIKNGV